MATVGDQLLQPETGWKRFYDGVQGLNYTGTWNHNGPGYHSSTEVNACISFTFYGQQLRVIGSMNAADSTNIQVSIDGVNYSYSDYAGSLLTNRLVFEKTNLNLGMHRVSITNLVGGKYFTFTAIDIDGYLIGYANLLATAGDSEITLSWRAIDGATGYNLKRSTTAGGPYTTIASNVFDTSYVDEGVKNGTTYYYVVTALNGDTESVNSNEASALPEGKALLRITLNDSSEREYRVSDSEVDSFVKWYDRTVNTGNTCYKFNDSVDGSKEYLSFEKIISFKVIPLAK